MLVPFIVCLAGFTGSIPTGGAADAPPAGRQGSSSGITHSFLALGAKTYILGADSLVRWTYPANTTTETTEVTEKKERAKEEKGEGRSETVEPA